MPAEPPPGELPNRLVGPRPPFVAATFAPAPRRRSSGARFAIRAAVPVVICGVLGAGALLVIRHRHATTDTSSGLEMPVDTSSVAPLATSPMGGLADEVSGARVESTPDGAVNVTAGRVSVRLPELTHDQAGSDEHLFSYVDPSQALIVGLVTVDAASSPDPTEVARRILTDIAKQFDATVGATLKPVASRFATVLDGEVTYSSTTPTVHHVRVVVDGSLAVVMLWRSVNDTLTPEAAAMLASLRIDGQLVT